MLSRRELWPDTAKRASLPKGESPALAFWASKLSHVPMVLRFQALALPLFAILLRGANLAVAPRSKLRGAHGGGKPPHSQMVGRAAWAVADGGYLDFTCLLRPAFDAGHSGRYKKSTAKLWRCAAGLRCVSLIR